MKKNAILILICFFSFSLNAQQIETFTKEDKTLIFTNEDPGFNREVKSGLVNTFFKVYPEMVRDFNANATDTIQVKIDTAYNGVAYAHNGEITISSGWLKKKPNDLDVITHEAMHVVQSYPSDSGPGWLTEGIADYVRFKYGVDNMGAGWSLPEYSPDNSYKNSYRITARFLAWAVKNYDENLVFTLDKHMRENNYSDKLWTQNTGMSLNELWEEYSKNPEL